VEFLGDLYFVRRGSVNFYGELAEVRVGGTTLYTYTTIYVRCTLCMNCKLSYDL
jgi:hypothetical protein